MKTPLKLYIIEDQADYREALTLLFSQGQDIKVTGTVGTAEKALSELKKIPPQEHPDVILLDLGLFGMQGGEAIPHLKKITPEANILVLTNSHQKRDLVEVLENGAAGYLLKSSTIEELKSGVRAVCEGGAPLSPQMAKYLLRQQPKKINQTIKGRKLEVLELLSEGCLKKEIADQLGISYTTVETYVKEIYRDLGVHNAPSAVGKAYRDGIL